MSEKKFPKEAPWNMMLADDVVICATELEEAEKQLEEWSYQALADFTLCRFSISKKLHRPIGVGGDF